jgi:hypothetical protein
MKLIERRFGAAHNVTQGNDFNGLGALLRNFFRNSPSRMLAWPGHRSLQTECSKALASTRTQDRLFPRDWCSLFLALFVDVLGGWGCRIGS